MKREMNFKKFKIGQEILFRDCGKTNYILKVVDLRELGGMVVLRGYDPRTGETVEFGLGPEGRDNHLYIFK